MGKLKTVGTVNGLTDLGLVYLAFVWTYGWTWVVLSAAIAVVVVTVKLATGSLTPPPLLRSPHGGEANRKALGSLPRRKVRERRPPQRLGFTVECA